MGGCKYIVDGSRCPLVFLNVHALPCVLAILFYFMPIYIIRILRSPDRYLGSTSRTLT